MKKEIKEDLEIEKTNFEGLEFEVLEMEKKCLISKEPNFYLNKQLIRIIFQIKMTENLKILKTAQEVRDHEGNIW